MASSGRRRSAPDPGGRSGLGECCAVLVIPVRLSRRAESRLRGFAAVARADGTPDRDFRSARSRPFPPPETARPARRLSDPACWTRRTCVTGRANSRKPPLRSARRWTWTWPSFTDEMHYRYAQSLLKTGQFGGPGRIPNGGDRFPRQPLFCVGGDGIGAVAFPEEEFRAGAPRALRVDGRAGPLEPVSRIRRTWSGPISSWRECYQAEADSLDASLHPSIPTPLTGRSADPVVAPAKAQIAPPPQNTSTQTEGK